MSEQSRTRSIYERYSSDPRRQRSWAASNPGNVAIRAELVDTVFALAGRELVGANEILDVGSGTGWWLELLAGHEHVAANLYGVDLLPDRVAVARARVPSAAIEIGDVRRLSYEDRSFDVVTLFTLLSSLPEPNDAEHALREARRVLRPNGVLLVWEPRVPNPLNPRTMLIRRGLLETALAGALLEARTTTLVPALARRLGTWTWSLYPSLVRVPFLRTHRLVCARV
jgi:ubiquinone/menaquinone biosynthesis C-methylase UbiE